MEGEFDVLGEGRRSVVCARGAVVALQGCSHQSPVSAPAKALSVPRKCPASAPSQTRAGPKRPSRVLATAPSGTLLKHTSAVFEPRVWHKYTQHRALSHQCWLHDTHFHATTNQARSFYNTNDRPRFALTLSTQCPAHGLNSHDPRWLFLAAISFSTITQRPPRVAIHSSSRYSVATPV